MSSSLLTIVWKGITHTVNTNCGSLNKNGPTGSYIWILSCQWVALFKMRRCDWWIRCGLLTGNASLGVGWEIFWTTSKAQWLSAFPIPPGPRCKALSSSRAMSTSVLPCFHHADNRQNILNCKDAPFRWFSLEELLSWYLFTEMEY